MNETKLTFKRTEKKYLLTPERYEALWQRIGSYLEPDDYPRSTVCSIYYDTDDYRLIRNSIEGPVYKEKLRLRCYQVPGPEDPVFVELKKKYKGVVYKRRVSLPAREAEAWLDRDEHPDEDSQMIREIDWFLHSVRPRAKAMLACDRASAPRGRSAHGDQDPHGGASLAGPRPQRAEDLPHELFQIRHLLQRTYPARIHFRRFHPCLTASFPPRSACRSFSSVS